MICKWMEGFWSSSFHYSWDEYKCVCIQGCVHYVFGFFLCVTMCWCLCVLLGCALFWEGELHRFGSCLQQRDQRGGTTEMQLIYLSACACWCFSVVVSAVNCVCCKSERELDQITKSLGTRLTPIPTREEGKNELQLKRTAQRYLDEVQSVTYCTIYVIFAP